jgi:hypothetical protein
VQFTLLPIAVLKAIGQSANHYTTHLTLHTQLWTPKAVKKRALAKRAVMGKAKKYVSILYSPFWVAFRVSIHQFPIQLKK